MKTPLFPLIVAILLVASPVSLKAQPANDDCTGAVPAALGGNPFDIATATDSAQPVDDSLCSTSLLGGAYHDLWWSYTAPSSGLLDVTLCDAADFDTDLIVYSGSCAALDVIGCNGDTPNCAVFTSEVRNIGVVSGETVFIRVGGWQPTSIGSGILTLELQQPLAQDLQCSDSGTELTASWSSPVTVDGWTVFVDGTLAADLPGSVMTWSGGNAPGIGESVEICIVASSASTGVCCTVLGTPVNDACNGATALISSTIDFETTGATTGSEPFDESQCATSLPGIFARDLWFSWVSPGDGGAVFSTCNTADFDTSIAVYRGSCASLQQAGCNGDTSNCATWTSVVSDIPVVAGEELLIRVGGWQSDSFGSGTLAVNFLPHVVENFEVSSVAGSGTVDVSWLAAADLIEATILVDGFPVWTAPDPIPSGSTSDINVAISEWPAVAEICLQASTAEAVGPLACRFVDVIEIPLEVVAGATGPIPDDGTATLFEAIVSATTPPADIRVSVDIDHPRIEDLFLRFSDPEGVSVTLFDSSVGEGDGLFSTYWQAAGSHRAPHGAGLSMRPAGPGSLLDLSAGSSPAGTWTLEVTDQAAGEAGSLEGWLLEIHDVPPAVLPGPDLIAGEHSSMQQLGRQGGEVGIMLQSVCCNQGNEPLDWHGNPSPLHPFMVFNLYRVNADRIVQVGGSWAKHAPGPATTANACGFGCTIPSDPWTLGVGCSDIYSAGYNGTQSILGPRSEIDPYTGSYDFNTSILNGPQPAFDPVERRLRALDVDIDPMLNPDSNLFVEAIYIAHDDPASSDNLIHDLVGVSGSTGLNWSFSIADPGTLGPAILSWPGAQFTEVRPDSASDGRSIVASKATALGGGVWRYEYAIFNHDLARGIGCFEVPVPAGVSVSDITFSSPVIETIAFSNDPWQGTRGADSVSWQTEPASSASAANPLRWGWLYNFGFTAEAAPEDSVATLLGHEIEEPMSAAVLGPPTAPGFIRSECNGDGEMNLADAVFLLVHLFQSGGTPPCLDACDINDDNAIDVADPIALLGWLFSGSPVLPDPYPNCGSDPTAGEPGCESPPVCP